MKHRYGGRCRSVTVGAPCMEWEQGAKNTESQEYHREEDALHFGRDLQFHNFKNVHGSASGSVEYTQDTDKQECRATHQHKGKLHGCVFFLSATPYTDKQVHRDKSYFVEHEHSEEVGRNKEAEYSGAK